MVSPGLSSIPANNPPNITTFAPAANDLATSPLYLMPPSAIIGMLKYGINDLRAFFETDYRWLNHFGFDPLDIPSSYRGLSR